jgi:hypothetical protein
MKYSMLGLVIFSLSISLAAMGETGEETCAEISFSSDRQECLDFLKDRYFDKNAGYVCSRARFSSGILGCVKVSADKIYTLDEANICNDESFDDNRIQCMRDRGRPTHGDPSYAGRLRTVNRFAKRARVLMEQGNNRGAYGLLIKIQEASTIDYPR